MIYGLTEEHGMIADTVRSFVEKEIYPHETLVERTGEVPHEIAQEIKQKTIDLFTEVQLPNPAQLYDRYPHEISGGQK